ncbi:hypothetical protein Patl1_09627 [Pistacia atlantica]|uniref:Uncharacterized protein n=1 Tax=Pistacia atlantica TaxID=434234 RepID=A0ACC1A9X6_9ROSI|nr:hypothetical protein Patl1_09627 [Pistacia atlantica]
MYPTTTPNMIQGQEDMQNYHHNHHHQNPRGTAGVDPCLVLTADPKPRLRWTADLHDRFVDAVTQLGGPTSQFFLTPLFFYCFAASSSGVFVSHCLFHVLARLMAILKGRDHLSDSELTRALVRYSYGEMNNNCRGYTEGHHADYECQGTDSLPFEKSSTVKPLLINCDDPSCCRSTDWVSRGRTWLMYPKMVASYLLESPTRNSSPSLPASDMHEGYEVKEALRAQMEVQSKLHLQVEAEKHLQIRQDAERRYLAMLERACKMLADQFIGGAPICMGQKKWHPVLFPQRADCSTESCLTSHDSSGGLTLEGSTVGAKKKMMSLDSTTASLLWGEVKMGTHEISLTQVNSHGITGYGI